MQVVARHHRDMSIIYYFIVRARGLVGSAVFSYFYIPSACCKVTRTKYKLFKGRNESVSGRNGVQFYVFLFVLSLSRYTNNNIIAIVIVYIL